MQDSSVITSATLGSLTHELRAWCGVCERLCDDSRQPGNLLDTGRLDGEVVEPLHDAVSALWEATEAVLMTEVDRGAEVRADDFKSPPPPIVSGSGLNGLVALAAGARAVQSGVRRLADVCAADQWQLVARLRDVVKLLDGAASVAWSVALDAMNNDIAADDSTAASDEWSGGRASVTRAARPGRARARRRRAAGV
jgi:hypothetical protein